ncbi:MAG: archaellin/type IV pilin N-terminal domain-containing protein [Candidatus Nanohaloarchaea archaeon]
MRKGISPLIAAVLMIAFTMAVASLFSGWIQDLQSSTQEDVSEAKEGAVSCTEYDIEIDDGTSNSTRLIQERGPDGVGNISVIWTYSDNTDAARSYGYINTSRGFDTVTTNASGTDDASLDQIQASSLNCSDVTATYSPS